MKLTGVFTIRNAIEAGYPFIEAILSLYPIVDDYYINDGGSNDGTLDMLKRLEDEFEKIRLFQIEDIDSEYWDCIDNSLNKMIDESDADWIIEGQGDEIWSAESAVLERQIIEKYGDKFNSIRQPRLDIDGWEKICYKMWTVRAVKNLPDLNSYEGGDSFHLGDHGAPTKGYTNHNVPPELKVDVPFHHLVEAFPENRLKKLERHAKHLSPEQDSRVKSYEREKSRKSS